MGKNNANSEKIEKNKKNCQKIESQISKKIVTPNV